jgi:cytochrome c-type biogenesis protein CcmF
MVCSLTLYALRAPEVRSKAQFNMFSRETFLLVNNLIFVVAWITVMMGTLYPLVLDFVGAGKLSIGPPYFNAVFAPLMSILALVMGFGVVGRWKNTEASLLIKQLRWVALLSVLLALALPFIVFEQFHLGAFFGSFLSLWVIGFTLKDVYEKSKSKRGLIFGLRRLSRSYMGMTLGHLGFAFSILGVTLVSVESVERDVRMVPGENVTVAGYNFNFESLAPYTGPNFKSDRGTVRVTSASSGDLVATLHPEKRVYFSSNNPMTEAGIDAGLFRDLYIALGEPLSDGAWAVRIQVKPFVRWIWLGTIFMAIGGLLAISDRRYRRKKTSNT